MENLAGKNAVVTGAASGIGRAVAGRLVEEGMNVVLADVEKPALDIAVDELSGGSGRVLGVVTDVSDGDSVDALARQAIDELGSVNLVHNNAGVGGGGMTWDLTTVDWAWVLGVNLWGVIHGIRAFLPHLIESGDGHVVNTASMAGMVAVPGMGPYNASKFAVVAISETLYRELQMAGHPVGVSVLCPGVVSTRIGESDRNRPESLRNPATAEVADDPQRQLARQAFMDILRTGMDPGEVAGKVVDAVRANRFYIFTHEMQGAIETRMRNILDGDNPVIAPFNL